MFVQFASRDLRERRRKYAVPGEREQLATEARAQAVGAFAAHPHMGGRARDAARPGEDLEEAELALGRPAVAAGSASSGRLWRAHPGAWITSAAV